ncbi:MAG: IPT/TIG domain-containing protein [Chitinophagaceae bacterium]|nr:IPT/TIG domain-containing protein [Chitinophagaceae bacterium]
MEKKWYVFAGIAGYLLLTGWYKNLVHSVLFAGIAGYMLITAGCNKDKDPEKNTAVIVSSFYPDSGKSHTLVTIEGSGFNNDYIKNEISFNDVPAEVVSVTTTRLVVRAPEGGSTGIIRLNANGQTLEVGTFTYQDLGIESVTPLRAVANDIVHIKGYGFEGDAHLPEVTLSNSVAKIVSISDTLLEVAVPANGIGYGPVKISIGNKQVTGPEFTIVRVLDYFPKAGFPGTEINIVGSGFSTELKGNRILYSFDTLEMIRATRDTLVARFQEKITTTTSFIYVQTEGIAQTLKSADRPIFYLLANPSITRLSASSLTPGSSLFIYGTNFTTRIDSLRTQVFIGPDEIPSENIASASNTNIYISSIPEGMQGGIVKVIANGRAAEGPYLAIVP